MFYYVFCLLVLGAAYFLNIFYISVLYHRGLTHGAVLLRPWVQKIVVWSGNWVTGIDPKGWTCMHRLHHQYSDTPNDPHSPRYQGVFRLMLGQLRSYNATLVRLLKKDELYLNVVKDLNFPVSWLNRHRLWFLPYFLHAVIALLIGFVFQAWLLAVCYWLGIMSHPIQGWMVNAFGHRFGYRNFATLDDSRNNTVVSILVFGEGYQNNHHHAPRSARFSARWWEVDMGYWLCRIAERFKLLEIDYTAVLPR